MELYILRHAIALPHGTPGYPNNDRPLSAEGKKKMIKGSIGMRMLVREVDEILTSPLRRTLETANITAQALGILKRVVPCDELLLGAPIGEIWKMLEHRPKKKKLMIVGHEPALSEFIAALLGMQQPLIDIKKGGICRIDINTSQSPYTGTLIWHVTPKQLRLLSDRKNHGNQPADKTSPVPRPSHRRRRN